MFVAAPYCCNEISRSCCEWVGDFNQGFSPILQSNATRQVKFVWLVSMDRIWPNDRFISSRITRGLELNCQPLYSWFIPIQENVLPGRPMGRERVEVAVMFADVAGSTSIYDRLGDDAANRIIGKAVDIMKQLTEMHNGQVIKTIGDEVMSRFPSADDCVNAAKEIQEEMEAGIQGEDLQIAIRVGLHFGPAILMEDGDVFGDAVNVAARMAGIAKADQIITTEETVKLLSPAHQDSTRQFDKTTVKGKAEQIIVYQVIWQNEDLTRIEIPMSAEDLETKYLVMNFKGEETKIGSDDHRVFTLGRGVQSDLCVNARLASRMHATIQFVRGKFLLTDQSSNGTFVKTDEGESIYLRRQELMLWGSGHISLGEEISAENPDLIRFICP